jgi:hypothetical protein
MKASLDIMLVRLLPSRTAKFPISQLHLEIGVNPPNTSVFMSAVPQKWYSYCTGNNLSST